MSQSPLVQQTMLDLLSKDQIVDAAGLRAAIDALSTFRLAATGLQAVVDHLLSIPEVFAYIISGISNVLLSAPPVLTLTVWDRCDDIISQIMTDFPTKSQEYPSSLASKVLDSLSMYFLAFPVESLETEVLRDISRNRGFIEGALPVLCALNTMSFTNEKSFEEDINVYDVDPNDGFIKLKVSQKTQKRNRQKPRATINTALFFKFGVTVPHTSEAAISLTIGILAELKEILSFYFSLLRRTELAGVIKALLFSNARESAKDVSPEVSSAEV
ncbi:hypothetical protein AZE42_07157, partial [Rhizopogon vesiculosus]